MSTKGRRSDSSKTLVARLAIFCVLAALSSCADLPLLGENAPQSQRPSSSDHQVVVLLDTNLNQRKVLPVELSLSEGFIQKLDHPGNVFSVITFGSNSPALLRSGVHADEAIVAIRDVTLEQTSGDYLALHLYEALNLAFGQFTDDARPKSLLIIAEGNDGSGKSFNQAVARAKQLHITCNVAMVADHSLYGSKATQRYGFYLRELARRTHGRYMEVGGRQRKVPPAADRLSESVLAQDQEQ